MKSLLALMVSASVLGGVAQAQTAVGGAAGMAEPGSGYVEGVVQSAFGNVTSQSYGAEAGVTIVTNVQVFVEAGRLRDAATPDLGVNAQTIAGALTLMQSNPVSYTVKEPVTFGVAGLKYLIPMSSKAQPYVMGGLGVAKYTKDVRFIVGGTDVTGTLAQYGVVLGSDLSGSFTKLMFTLGGGVVWPAWQSLIVDFQYRFGRILADNQAFNVSRAGVGIGVLF